MSFLRRLLGSGDKRRPDRAAPPPARPGARASQGPAPVRPTPTLADASPRPLRSYLEYVGGGSSKFYAISLEEEDGETWRVRSNFGRIGFPRAWDTRIADATWARAAKVYTALVDE